MVSFVHATPIGSSLWPSRSFPLFLYEKIGSLYQREIQKLVSFLQDRGWFLSSLVFGTLLSEPLQVIKAGFFYPFGWKNHFNFYHLNPKAITEKQISKRPILLIHGNLHNQSAWFGLIKKMRNLGPIYTVNLPNGNITKHDYAIIDKKILEIQAQYKELIKIDVIGHSRGGFLACREAWTVLKADGKRYWSLSEHIAKVITIGSVLDQEDIESIKRIDCNFTERIYEITGEYDILSTNSSLLASDHQKKVCTGHLGLLYSGQVHQQVINWLS